MLVKFSPFLAKWYAKLLILVMTENYDWLIIDVRGNLLVFIPGLRSVSRIRLFFHQPCWKFVQHRSNSASLSLNQLRVSATMFCYIDYDDFIFSLQKKYYNRFSIHSFPFFHYYYYFSFLFVCQNAH